MNDDQRLLLQESPPPSLSVNPGTPGGWNSVENEIGCQLPDAFFDYDDNEHYPMGLVKFLAQWTSGGMPESFFGTGNSPEIIRRDPVFCPAGQVRAPRPPG